MITAEHAQLECMHWMCFSYIIDKKRNILSDPDFEKEVNIYKNIVIICLRKNQHVLTVVLSLRQTRISQPILTEYMGIQAFLKEVRKITRMPRLFCY